VSGAAPGRGGWGASREIAAGSAKIAAGAARARDASRDVERRHRRRGRISRHNGGEPSCASAARSRPTRRPSRALADVAASFTQVRDPSHVEAVLDSLEALGLLAAYEWPGGRRWRAGARLAA